MSTPNANPESTPRRPRPQAAQLQLPIHTMVSLTFVNHGVIVNLRFGNPVREIKLDRCRRIAVRSPAAVCCRIQWIGNAYGTVRWQLTKLQAQVPFDDMQLVAGVTPGARMLLRAMASHR